MQSQPWFENDAFWIATYAFMFPESSFATAASDIPKLLALSGCGEGAALDMCCGPGRHAVPLAKRGFKVTGVDRTSFLLNKAKAYADREQVRVDLIEDDMRNFVKPDTFDIALSMFTSFGFFADRDDNQIVLRKLHNTLRHGGALVMDTMG